MEAETTMSPFGMEIVRQIRALDQFGNWARISDEELLVKKYVKTKEELKAVPLIADIDEMMINDIKMIYKAIALSFERQTGVVCNVIMEMSHEGFGRCAVIADRICIVNKYFKDAHRFSYRTLEALFEDGDKTLQSAMDIYAEYKPCIKQN
ncbi:NifX-associated nitrogen fixation protein [Sulfuricurvum sp.]|jgi:probable nitrogen fixation protein|uniref:NifX-associated nitrogen fixation protein n=1 Tax=Sulfuricurvum sp. TaxID=2025608 RepID=UPI0026207B7A|nr:NifX-associated nitrogen fixation protein [Sulfuricurvum sp.]MDD2838086.1 NifX-associated nitrogen fixation protein [Sulfuricurvum sp.]MDD3596661.1 NifX-associated nitrogen fixation protein [Sulfuricurvum sp.]MDD4884906.1 NifX-associated nitrogen fixation protein [Sulfuricurvum sp.]